MSTRLNLLLICMLLLLSMTIVAPYALHHREAVIADGRAVRSGMTSIAQRVLGGDGVVKDENGAADFSQIQRFSGGLGNTVERAMTENAKQISHMLNTKFDDISGHMAVGLNVDKKEFGKDLSMFGQDYPELAGFVRNLDTHVATAIGMVAQHLGQPPMEVAAVTVKSKPDALHKIAKIIGSDNDVGSADADSDHALNITRLLSAPSALLKSGFQTIFGTGPSDIEL